MAYNNVYKTKFLLPRIYVAGVGVISTSESAPATWPGGLRRDGVSVCSSPRLSPGQVQSCLLSVPGGTDQAKCQVTCLLNKRCELWRSQAQELPWERSPTGQGAFTPKTLFALFGQKILFYHCLKKGYIYIWFINQCNKRWQTKQSAFVMMFFLHVWMNSLSVSVIPFITLFSGSQMEYLGKW